VRASEVGASREVIEHHARQHPCGEHVGARHVWCSCGTTVALVCDACQQPVFMATRPGSWCPHAAGLVEAAA
jgi:hypothetical protein